ncbi:hypothetical protein KUTeg_006616 [Tegillarca granosa]|uniref:Uncharacterized protein n=1 Tax=Tegillarca granosa TaxID=220873 RepID=A0ABQ9FAW9_TEGGR|nr:hypothetical protein KUTeg_006616 [Tegillarca granosa]
MSISNAVVFIDKDETYADYRSGKCGMFVCQGIICSAIERILNNPSFDKSNSVVIADYGTADGSNAIPTIKKIIDIIRNRLGEKQDILLVFEDQEANNYNALFDEFFQRLRKGQKEIPNFDENTFVVASSKDMFKQCMPSKSVDLVLSTIAVQTLSCLPCTIKGGITIADANEEEYVDEWLLLHSQSSQMVKVVKFCQIDTSHFLSV